LGKKLLEKYVSKLEFGIAFRWEVSPMCSNLGEKLKTNTNQCNQPFVIRALQTRRTADGGLGFQ
jgi:hypothetical protein